MASKRPAADAKPAGGTARPKPPCTLDPTSIVADKAVLVGTHSITIHANAVIHPYAQVDSTHGPVDIGEYSIVAERATVGPAGPDDAGVAVTVLGHVNIETGARVHATRIGRGTTIGAYATLASSSTVGEFCKFAPYSTIQAEAIVADFTIYTTENETRTDTTTSGRSDIQDLKIKAQVMHVDALRRLIPSNTAKWQ